METKLLYTGWLLLLISCVFNISIIVCQREDISKLKREKEELKLENNNLKNYSWYCEQITYIIENGGFKNETK